MLFKMLVQKVKKVEDSTYILEGPDGYRTDITTKEEWAEYPCAWGDGMVEGYSEAYERFLSLPDKYRQDPRLLKGCVLLVGDFCLEVLKEKGE